MGATMEAKTLLAMGLAPGTRGDGALRFSRGMAYIQINGDWTPLPARGGAFGTIGILDSLAATNQSIVAIGENTVWGTIRAAMEAHNAVVNELMTNFVESTTDRRRRYGGDDAMVFEDIDEFGRADAQKITAGADVDFPLRKVGGSLQWTLDSMEVMTGEQMAANVTRLMTGDLLAFQRDIRRALFRATNYTVLDRLVDGTTLNVKRLVNADSAPIPIGPQAETFDPATHTHYLATAAFIAANMDSLILAVTEHVSSGTVRVYINRAQEAAVRALPGFNAYLPAQLVNQTAGVVTQTALQPFDLNNREIGFYMAAGLQAVVSVKPWVPASYLFAWVDGARPPVVRRIRNAARSQLRLVAENEAYPLRARTYEREHGFGIYNRVNGAVLYIGGGAYVDPTMN